MRGNRARAGESISETLIAVLMLSLVFLMLTGAAVSAARVNARLRNADAAFAAGSVPEGADGWGVTVRMDGHSASCPAELYRAGGDGNWDGYYYYEYDPD